MARRTGNLIEEDSDLNGLAAILANQGNYEKADAMYRELLRDAHQMNSGWDIQMALNNLGNDLLLEGNLTEAKQMQEEALGISRHIGLKAAAADELLSLAQINLAEADTLNAKRDAAEALSIFTKLQDEEEKAVALSLLGNIERVTGNLNRALKNQREAVDALSKLGGVAVLAESRLELARSFLDTGEAKDVISLSQLAAAEFVKQKRPDEEACARATLALALAQRGNSELAQHEIHQALSLIGKAHSEIPRDEVQIDATLLAARFLRPASQNEIKHAVETVRLLAERAERMHLELIAMDARIAEAELILSSSSIQENQSRLERIETDARRAGDLRVARRAKQLMGSLVPEEIGFANDKGSQITH
jgi:tetratricopeptide (TPR) repeat protein